jgi:MSHA biogenesis protein MshN
VDDVAMSLINQVINQLERRGAENAADISMVRPVPKIASPRKYLLPSLLGLCAIAALVWLGLIERAPQKNASLPVARPSSPIAQLAPAPVSAVFAESGVADAAPVFQLSFELGAVVMPDLATKSRPLAQKKIATEKPAVAPFRAKPPPRALDAPKVVAEAPQPTLPVDNTALPMKQISPKQQAEAEFRKAVLLMQQGRIADALSGYEAALNLDAGYDPARQALVLLLIENKRATDAERVLLEGIKSRPEKIGFVMMAARLQVERGAINDGVATLEKSLPFAGQQADYQAFLAALLQRQERHKDAVEHYQIALRQTPNNGLWWMGEGISLQALQRNVEAKEAYKRALGTQTLRPDLQDYVQQKLKGL